MKIAKNILESNWPIISEIEGKNLQKAFRFIAKSISNQLIFKEKLRKENELINEETAKNDRKMKK